MEDISKMANKQDLIAEVAAKTGLTKKDSEKDFIPFIREAKMCSVLFKKFLSRLLLCKLLSSSGNRI